MVVLEFTTNLLDLGAFFFATPELIGKERMMKLSNVVEVLFHNFGLLNYSVVARRVLIKFVNSMYWLLFSGIIAVVGVLILHQMFNDPDPPPPVFMAILSIVPIYMIVGFIMSLWLYLFLRYDISRTCLVLGAALFIAARVVGIVGAVNG
jgi:hypothetical protein